MRKKPASSPRSATPRPPPCATAARCCSPTGANCGLPASKSPTTAAPPCRHWSPAIRCGLEKLGPERDRYGRLVAFAYPGDGTQSIQQMLLAQGRARVSARVGDKPCAEALFTVEKAARDGPARVMGRSKFRPFVGGKPCPASGRARPLRAGGRQGLVGARKWGHSICEFRAALDARFHRGHSAALAPPIHGRRRRAETARRPPHQGARLDRTARRPGDRN